MNDIINHLKNLYIHVEIKRKEANKPQGLSKILFFLTRGMI